MASKIHAMELFDRTALFLHNAVNHKGRMSAKDYEEATGASQRSSQRALRDLERLGYLVSDDAVPTGWRPTEKTKTIFKKAGEQ